MTFLKKINQLGFLKIIFVKNDALKKIQKMTKGVLFKGINGKQWVKKTTAQLLLLIL